MIKEQILLSFVGNRDPYTENDEPGPLLSLLQHRVFDRVVLFCSSSGYIERARDVEEIVRDDFEGRPFSFVDLQLESPVDYSEIYEKLRRTITRLIEKYVYRNPEYSILLDSGTPQIQTGMFLLVQTGFLQARLLQGVPPKFAGGSYKVRVVELNKTLFGKPDSIVSGDSFEDVPRDVPRDVPGFGDVPAGSNDYILFQSAPHDQAAETWINGSTRAVIGQSKMFKQALQKALQVAKYDISVMVRGETGTGKGVFARLVHEHSHRSGKPFLSVNCAGITPSLAESELFGHVKGAFTGADRDRIGQIRAAAGGTVFLDEIGDLPLELQPKLLRFLEEHIVVPVGTETECHADVRVIAATNRDLEEMIRERSFRRDLFERLNHVTLEVPTLRERLEDIPLLLQGFIAEWNTTYHEEKGLSLEAVDLLTEYPWPGNVRELQNAVKSILAVGRSSSIGPEFFPPAVRRHFSQTGPDVLPAPDIPDEGMDIRAFLFQIEKTFYEKALEKCRGNREQAAGLLGLNAPAFRKALRERFDLPGSEG